MTFGEINLHGFAYSVLDAEGIGLGANGQPNGQKVPMKVLRVQDSNAALAINLHFTAEQFPLFVAGLSGNKIIAPDPSAIINLSVVRNGK